MSYSVVKQSLQLLHEGVQQKDVLRSSKSEKTKNAMKLIKTSRKGVWRELRRLQKQEQKKKKNKFQKPNFKSAVEQFQEDQRVKTDGHIAAPEPVQEESKAKKCSKKVLEYLLQFSSRSRHKQAEKKDESTVFTDRDFDKFEEEYDFFDSV